MEGAHSGSVSQKELVEGEKLIRVAFSPERSSIKVIGMETEGLAVRFWCKTAVETNLHHKEHCVDLLWPMNRHKLCEKVYKDSVLQKLE